MARLRRTHRIRANKSNQRPERHLFVDVESRLVPISDTETEHRLWFGCWLYWRRRPDRKSDTLVSGVFHETAEFWDLVEEHVKPKSTLYLIAHNISYDLGVLRGVHELPARGYELTSIYLGGMTSILQYKGARGNITILDNGNYFSGALAKWGAAIGYDKLDVDPLTATYEVALPYCKRDCEIMWRLWSKLYEFLDDNDLGNFGRTLPSQAFNAYRHRFMSHPIMVHNDEAALELERQAYHGGRTSVFYRGELTNGPYYKLDVNSMYPAMMTGHEYPCRLARVMTSMSTSQLARLMTEFDIIANVRVTTDKPVYPVRSKTHILYPVGQFTTSLSTPELRHALETNAILSVATTALYYRAPLFSEYVSFFYTLKRRLAGEPGNPYYAFTKLYLNSLYGKFGQRSHDWEKLNDPDGVYAETDYRVNAATGQRSKVYHIGPDTWTCTETGEAFNSFPAIAAHVTAYARMYLWELRQAAGEDHFFYTDTDSCLVDSVGMERLTPYLDDTRLGALKIEEVSECATILAPKVYTFAGETKRKGVPKKAALVASDTWEFDRFPSLRSQSSWAKHRQYFTRRTSRHLSYAIFDGHINEEGWITPLDASTLPQAQTLTPATLAEIDDLRAQIEALKWSKPLDAQTVFSLWDYRKGDWRRNRTERGELVALEYSATDGLATELGFLSLAALQAAVIQCRGIDREIAECGARMRDLLEGESSSSQLPVTEFNAVAVPMPF